MPERLFIDVNTYRMTEQGNRQSLKVEELLNQLYAVYDAGDVAAMITEVMTVAAYRARTRIEREARERNRPQAHPRAAQIGRPQPMVANWIGNIPVMPPEMLNQQFQFDIGAALGIPPPPDDAEDVDPNG